MIHYNCPACFNFKNVPKDQIWFWCHEISSGKIDDHDIDYDDYFFIEEWFLRQSINIQTWLWAHQILIGPGCFGTLNISSSKE